MRMVLIVGDNVGHSFQSSGLPNKETCTRISRKSKMWVVLEEQGIMVMEYKDEGSVSGLVTSGKGVPRCGSASCSAHDAFVILALYHYSKFFIHFYSFSIHPEFITKELRVGTEFSFVRILNFEIASGHANTQKEWFLTPLQCPGCMTLKESDLGSFFLFGSFVFSLFTIQSFSSFLYYNRSLPSQSSTGWLDGRVEHWCKGCLHWGQQWCTSIDLFLHHTFPK